jgi:hypothetical protein
MKVAGSGTLLVSGKYFPLNNKHFRGKTAELPGSTEKFLRYSPNTISMKINWHFILKLKAA